jgi:membrane protease subunit HflK
MPWKTQGGGGGPWGGGSGGGRGPWGGGGGGGQQPPDLEEMLKRGQDQFRRMVPGGFGMGKGLALAGLVVLVLWGLSGFYRVQPEEQGVVLRFGEYVRTTQPGLNYHLPSPIEAVITPAVTRVNRVDIGFRQGGDVRTAAGAIRSVDEEALMLTGDENIVEINFTVFWIIKDAGLFLFNIREPEATVKTAAESVMREVIGRTPIAFALAEGRQQIEEQTMAQLRALLDAYGSGIEVTQVQLQKVDPPAPVIDAYRDVQRARADQERLRNEAETYRNQIIPRARGDAERQVQEAEAYKQEIVARASGDADRFNSVYQAYAVNKEVTVRRLYLETLEEVLPHINKIMMDGGSGASPVVPYLALPELQRRATTNPVVNPATTEVQR